MSMPKLMRILGPLALFVSMLMLYVPFNPGMPAASLDPSWALGMNELASRHAVFGRDVVFTFGPLAAVYTTYFHPATDTVVLWTSAWLACAAMGCWVLILRGCSPWAWLAVAAVCSLTIQSRDALLFAVPLLASLASAFWSLDQRDGAEAAARAGWFPALPVLAVAWAAVGVLPLIKGTMLVMAVGLVLLTAGFLVCRRHLMVAAMVLLLPPLVSAFSWQALGQPLSALPGFLGSMSEVIRGYTEAMAYGLGAPRSFLQVIFFVLLSALMVQRAVAHGVRHDRVTAFFLFAVLSGGLFLSFKAGFVRHDEGHAIISMNVALLLWCVAFARLGVAPAERWKWLLVAVLLWYAVMDGFRGWSPAQHLPQWWSGQRASIDSLQTRLTRPEAMPAVFRASFERIRAEHPLPRLPGVIDVYSTNHAVALAHELPWRPRPVLQSYSAYTPALAELNRAHLAGEQAPDWIWFTVEPIDGRLASQEDGASWPILLSDYEPVQKSGSGLVLQRRTPRGHSVAPASGQVLIEQRVAMGQRVAMPADAGPLTLSIQIQRNLFGRLLQTAYKARSLAIELELKTGEIKRLRVVSGMLDGEILLSPLVEQTEDFAMLYGDLSLLADKQVLAIRLIEADVGPSHWQGEFDLTVRRASAVGRWPEAARSVLDLQQPQAMTAPVVVSPVDCAGHLDEVNAVREGEVLVHRSPLMRARGWMLGSGEFGPQRRQPFMLLQSPAGRWRLPLSPQPRPDVAAHLGLNSMADSGWSVLGDLRSLSGAFTAHIAYEDAGVVYACNSLKLNLQRP